MTMKLFSIILCCSALLGGCDSGTSSQQDCPDALASTQPKLGSAGTLPGCSDGGAGAKSDGQVATTIPTTPFPYFSTPASDYTSSGVTAALGPNNCTTTTIVMGWEPGMSLCWPATESGGRGGICGVLTTGCESYPAGTCASMPACGTYAPGTLRVWSMDDPRYKYLGDPATYGNAGTGGYVCLPNAAPYVVPC
jgi:hypothetical protein